MIAVAAMATLSIALPASAATLITGSGTSNVIVDADGSPFAGFNGGLEVVITPDYSTSYVVDQVGDRVIPFDLATETVLPAIPLAPGSDPGDIAISPDGSRLYVSSYALNIVNVIDTATNTVLVNMLGIASPQGIAVSPDGAEVWINEGGNVRERNAATFTQIGTTIVLAGNPNAIAMSPDGSKVVVSNGALGNAAIIDTATHAVVIVPLPALPPAPGPFAVAISPDSSTAWIADNTNNLVYPINLATNVLGTGVAILSGSPLDLQVSPNGDWLYVSTDGGTVEVIEIADTNHISTITGSGSMYGLAVSSDGTRIQATNYTGNSLYIFNLAELTVSGLDPVNQGDPVHVTVSMDDGLAVPDDYSGGDVQVLLRNAANVAVYASPVLHLDPVTNALELDIPTAALPLGTYTIEAVWILQDIPMSARAAGLDIIAVLPATGAEALPLVVGAVLLLLAGAALALSRRRSAES